MSDEIILSFRTKQRALVMELESTAIPIRRTMFEILQRELANEGITFDEPAMMRLGLHAVPAHLVADIAVAYSLPEGARSNLLRTLQQDLSEYFRSAAVAMVPGLSQVLDQARAAGAAVGLLSWQSEPEVRALVERIGLTKWEPVVSCTPNPDREFPGVDAWLQLLLQMNRQPQDSVALCRHRAAARTALTAGLRVVVVPDDFTLFQDFSGVDALAHHFEDLTAQQLFGAV